MGNKEESIKSVNKEAEISVIYSCIIDPEALNHIISKLKPDDFYYTKHQHIIHCIIEMYGQGIAVDTITLTAYAEKNKVDITVSDISTIFDGNVQISSTNIEYYLDIVIYFAMLRKLHKIGSKITVADIGSVKEIIASAETQLIEIIDINLKKHDLEKIATRIEETKEYIYEPDFKHDLTGFNNFNNKVKLKDGVLMILAARPSIGKTAFALNVAECAALRYMKKVAFFSVEMNSKELISRLLVSISDTTLNILKSKERKDILQNACNRLLDSDIYIDDSSYITTLEIYSKCKKLKLRRGLDLVIIDYLQLIQGLGSKYETRNAQVTEISRQLKLLARDLGIPVIVLSQLNRDMEKTGRSPQLSDLRDSGSLEQDADIVAFLHRKNRNLTNFNTTDIDSKERSYENIECIIAKNRNGETGIINFQFFRNTVKFAEGTKSDYE